MEQFSLWADQGVWGEFHSNHYDWWAFPINQPSSHGFLYSVTDEAAKRLREDSEFLKSLEESARLVLLSWGWSLDDFLEIQNPSADQKWAHWPIRLYKCYQSLRLFQLDTAADSVLAYARLLKEQGQSFVYSGRDLYSQMVGDEI